MKELEPVRRIVGVHCDTAFSINAFVLLAAMLTASNAAGDDQANDNAAFLKEQPITDSDRDHWSFGPQRDIEIPDYVSADTRETAPATATESAIDALAFVRLKQAGLDPSPQADRRTLLRRLTFDLTGLPPTVEALDRFCTSEEPDAWDREVDRLLASPGYGEHMAQAWLDLARFAETDGFEHDKVRPDAYRYRDWVISALNDDIGYDRFAALQLAGDRMGQNDSSNGGDDESAKVATMFCLSGPDMPDINDQLERRHSLLNEMTATVGSVFYGLQFGCAQCHDHKVDPISQADFYRLRAALETGVPELKRDKPVSMMTPHELAAPARFYRRGDFRNPGPEVSPAVPRLAELVAIRPVTLDASDPRTGLAAQLFSPSNPLTARTTANRLWQRHFGVGLAATSGDLGMTGTEPLHQDLLEWTAGELRRDWDLKRMDRRIVTSQFYCQASRLPADADVAQKQAWQRRLDLDPDNKLLSRFPRRRLTGEMLRDAMLFVSCDLNRQAFGPGVMSPLPAEILNTLLPGQWQVSPSTADHHRRSIYLFARRNLRYPIFETFDRPDAGTSCPVRDQSTTALQALTLLNSEFSAQAASSVAKRVGEVSADPSEQVQELVRRVLNRPVTESEQKLLTDFLQQGDSDPAARLQAAALALINSNEFAILD